MAGGGEIREIVEDAFAMGVSVFLLYMALRFFDYSIASLARDVPFVTAGIMSGLIGLLSLSGAITIVRDWLLARRARKGGGEG